MVDYCFNTPPDGLTTAASVENIKRLVRKNRETLGNTATLGGA